MDEAEDTFSLLSLSHRSVAKALPSPTGFSELERWILARRDLVQVLVATFIILVFDLTLLRQGAKEDFRGHAQVLSFMVLCSVSYGVAVWRYRGAHDGEAWAMGYLLEWALSLDNLFVFHLIFKSFQVPPELAQFALMIGIYGAIVLRVLLILGLSVLLSLSYWVYAALGISLIASGLMALQDDDDGEDISDLRTVRFFKWLFGRRLQESYGEGGRLFVCDGSGLRVTLLFLVVCIVMVVDVLFALDSAGSKTGIVTDPYINLSSSLLAMLSLRAMFFIVRDMIDHFALLKYGICAILMYIGVGMILQRWVQIPLDVTCGVIVLLFAVSVLASAAQARLGGAADKPKALNPASG